MLCHVTRPDSVVMEVEVDAKANGEDCLNKVGCVIVFALTQTYLLIFIVMYLKCFNNTYFVLIYLTSYAKLRRAPHVVHLAKRALSR